jgi:hypothetical protein
VKTSIVQPLTEMSAYSTASIYIDKRLLKSSHLASYVKSTSPPVEAYFEVCCNVLVMSLLLEITLRSALLN